MPILHALLILCLLLASLYDVRIKKIPNWLSLALMVSGLIGNGFAINGLSLTDSGAGLAVGFSLMLPGYLFGSMGAGDVKLMAAIGSVVGAMPIVDVVVYSYLLLLVLAVLFIVIKGDLMKLLRRYQLMLYGLFSGVFAYQKPDSSEAAGQRIPLAPAIALATCYVLYPTLCNTALGVNPCL
ncbi:MAG: A24 family peptidase [Methylobacter sp.]|nr:A24 family peptidase [Methylobacter sp.]MDP2099484.1 A24 family peptidase [Methylobacter sp.]MDP2429724.1 A24 family peptidase [Methylobacter sp.]MDP3054354.1 A24 family peptidase [Methylobacter sp.]MDP3360998.1 A24 family peptidase [Methylobacter sp.]